MAQTNRTIITSNRHRKHVLQDQHKKTAIAAKYGKRRKPAPVKIRTLDGDLVRVVDQTELVTQGKRRLAEAA